MTIISPTAMPTVLPCAEPTDGDGRESEFATTESTYDLNFIATDNMAEAAMDNKSPEEDFDDFIDAFVRDARDCPASKESSGVNFCLAPMGSERTIEDASIGVGSVLAVNPQTDMFVAFDGINSEPHKDILTARHIIEHGVNEDNMFHTTINAAFDSVVPNVSTKLPNYESVLETLDAVENVTTWDEQLNVPDTTTAARPLKDSCTADIILIGQRESASLPGSKGGVNHALDDGLFSAFDAMDVKDMPTPSDNVEIDEHGIIPAPDCMVDCNAGNNVGSFTNGVQWKDIDTATANIQLNFVDIDKSNDKVNANEGGSHFLNNSGLPEHETGANGYAGKCTTTIQTESSLCYDVAILDESNNDVICSSPDHDVFAIERRRNDVEPSDEMYIAETMASTSIEKVDTDFNDEDSNPAEQEAITSVDEDFGGFAFSEVDTKPANGFPSFDEVTPNLTTLEYRVTSMSEIVGQSSTSLPDGYAADGAMTNSVEGASNESFAGDALGASNLSDVSGRLKLSTSTILYDPDAGLEHVDSVGDIVSHEESGNGRQSEANASLNENGFGDFEAFADITEATTPITQGSSVLKERDSLDEKEGGDPSQFRRMPDMQYATTDKDSVTSQPLIVETTDEGFGDFGDFEVGDVPADEQSHEAAAIEAPNVENAANDESDEFGDFGDFDAFEDAVVKEITPLVVASGSQPTEMVSSADDNAKDEFGDFGEFEKFDSAPEKTDVTFDRCLESRQVPLLNESVRRMFQDVFKHNNDPTAFSFGVGGTCSQLPFDVPMSKILSELAPPRETDSSHTHKSEQGLAMLKKFYASLPISPPSTVPSKEKWYPYSQYEFNRDGSPYTPPVELVPASSVPEVLSIELPTCFEATTLSSSTSISPPSLPKSSTRSTATFPSPPTSMNHLTGRDSLPGSEGSSEPDLSQLSDEGKRFMEEIPDLSYMLKSTLSLPKE